MPKRTKLPARMGKPPHEPTDVTRQLARELKALFMTNDQVAVLMGISTSTLDKYYQLDLLEGKASGIRRAAQTMSEMAREKDHKSAFQAAQLILQTHGGWKRDETLNLQGNLQIESTTPDIIDSRSLSPEERDALRSIVTTALAKRIEETEPVIEGDWTDEDV